MSKFLVETQWIMTKTIEVEADSLEDAIEKIQDDVFQNDIPSDGEYLTDSFEINKDITAELNKKTDD